MQINEERLAREFTTLCEIDSPSGREGRVAEYLKNVFRGLEPELLEEDDTAAATGADCGNLLVRFAGTLDLEPVFFNCHMDTVGPAEGVRVARQGRTFSSAGDTVLGADDKAGIAALIEVMRCCREQKIDHGPVEFLFTTSEETGLRGAKAFDPKRLRAKRGYALDTTGIDHVIVGAPAANRFTFEVHGIPAHAGLAPEQGISAIQLAARAIATLRLGRLDPESTANIGTIQGGSATNIIPALATVEGEVRSHSEAKLAAFTEEMVQAFKKAVEDFGDPSGQAKGRPRLACTIREDYPLMRVGLEEPVNRRVDLAARSLGREIRFQVAGGGSDANIFNSRGLSCVIVGTGMNKVHTTEETVELDDMVRCAELVGRILTG